MREGSSQIAEGTFDPPRAKMHQDKTLVASMITTSILHWLWRSARYPVRQQ